MSGERLSYYPINISPSSLGEKANRYREALRRLSEVKKYIVGNDELPSYIDSPEWNNSRRIKTAGVLAVLKGSRREATVKIKIEQSEERINKRLTQISNGVLASELIDIVDQGYKAGEVDKDQRESATIGYEDELFRNTYHFYQYSRMMRNSICLLREERGVLVDTVEGRVLQKMLEVGVGVSLPIEELEEFVYPNKITRPTRHTLISHIDKAHTILYGVDNKFVLRRFTDISDSVLSGQSFCRLEVDLPVVSQSLPKPLITPTVKTELTIPKDLAEKGKSSHIPAHRLEAVRMLINTDTVDLKALISTVYRTGWQEKRWSDTYPVLRDILTKLYNGSRKNLLNSQEKAVWEEVRQFCKQQGITTVDFKIRIYDRLKDAADS